jgi:flavin reductase (DIM6/NTAB) family NADH-FMN oxidoreductase RutF
MDQNTKKHALRMIESGVFVITANTASKSYGSTVTWVTQTSFNPPLIVVALRVDSGIYFCVRDSRKFALHILGKDQKEFAANFFRSSKSDSETINKQTYTLSQLGNPILDDAIAVVECLVKTIVEEGNHHLVVGEVVNAIVRDSSSVLALRDTGWLYGG